MCTIPDDDASLRQAEHPERWRDWAQWANLLQFVRSPGRSTVICAASEADDLPFDDVWLLDRTPASPVETPIAEAEGDLAAVAETELTDDMRDELDFVEDEAVRELVEAVLRAGAPPFVAGYEVDYEPVEAGWPDARVAVVPDGDERQFPDWEVRPVGDWTVAELLGSLGADR